MTYDATSMTDQRLEDALRALGGELAYPGPTDLASTVAARLASAPAPIERRYLLPSLRPVRRSLILAFAAVLLIAALVTAAVLGVPGIRILFGPTPSGPTPGVSVAPSASPAGSALPGATLGLGARVDLERAMTVAGFAPLLPTDPAIGPPDAAYLEDARITLVWATRAGLPATADPAVGLLITEFRGQVDPGAYTKMANSGTRIERVIVSEQAGYWLSGDEHFIFYTDEAGIVHDKSWRAVGDALIWHDGELTYRIESALGRDQTIRLAETLAPAS